MYALTFKTKIFIMTLVMINKLTWNQVSLFHQNVCLSEFEREEKMFAETRKRSSVTHSAVVTSLPP